MRTKGMRLRCAGWWAAAVLICACTGLAVEPGLVGEYYNDFKVVDGRIVFDGLNLVKTQVDTNFDNWNGASSFNWDPIGGGNFSVRWTGYFYAPVPGRYGFGTISDDGSQIILDRILVLNNGEPQWFDWQEAYATLEAGYHAIEIDYYDSGVFSGIEVWLLPPSIQDTTLPYSGDDFHGIPPTFNPNTQWSVLGPQNLVSEPPVPEPELTWRYLADTQQLELTWMTSTKGDYYVESTQDFQTWQRVGTVFKGTGDLLHTMLKPLQHAFFRVVAFPNQVPPP